MTSHYKKKILFVLPLFLFLLLFTISCNIQSNEPSTETIPPLVDGSETPNDKEPANGNNQLEEPKGDDEEPSTDKGETDLQEDSIKYYVNQNYFIKPLDPEQDNKVVLLTFDDAPQNKVTKEILDILDKHNAKAIFFINGHYAVKSMELVKEISDRGHILANHTWWHENLKNLDYNKSVEEIVKVNDLIEEVTGERPKYFRPPFGVMSDLAREIIATEGMQSMNWSLGSLDWEYTSPDDSEKVLNQVIDNLIPGANILMHDKEVTANVLDEMLNKIEEAGYTFVLPTEVIID